MLPSAMPDDVSFDVVPASLEAVRHDLTAEDQQWTGFG